MIRRVAFASCYVYTPSGAGAVSGRSRLLRECLKGGDMHFIRRYAGRVQQQMAPGGALKGFVGPQHVLVPVPGSRPNRNRRGGSRLVAEALLAAGLGLDIWEALRRVSAVRKSATAPPGCRPTIATHYASLAVATTAAPPASVVLIDDVVTKGRTLLAAAARLSDAYPAIEIRAFALLRTMGMVDRIDRLLEPCLGEIRWRAGDAVRSP